MAVASADRQQVRTTGAYLTDGRRLFCVVEAEQGQVALENCRCPDENPLWLAVPVVCRDMQLVRTSSPVSVS